MTERLDAISNLTLGEEASQQPLLPPGSSYMEGSSFLMLAESGDYDIALAHVLFRVGGGKQGVWQVEDTGMLQTTLIVAPKDQRGVVSDNDFISNRNFATDWSGDAQVLCKKETVVWQLHGVQHVCRPPYWEFKGRHNGVEFDLRASGLGAAGFWKGQWEELASSGAAGYGQPLRFTGSIRANGKTFAIDNGLGSRDHFIHTRDLPAIYHQARLSYYWLWCLDPALRFMVYQIPGVRSYSEVNARGEDLPFGDAKTAIEPLEWWVDPRTGVQVPIRWHLTMQSANGSADVVMTAGSRALYGYLTRSGLSLHIGFLARANGHFTHADGRRLSIVDAQAYVEWGRSLFPLGSGTAG